MMAAGSPYPTASPLNRQAHEAQPRRQVHMDPHSHHFVYSLPPEGAHASLEAARREA